MKKYNVISEKIGLKDEEVTFWMENQQKDTFTKEIQWKIDENERKSWYIWLNVSFGISSELLRLWEQFSPRWHYTFYWIQLRCDRMN